MSVICFSSLKGGVGKTSLSVNIAHAFATRGCETVLIDLDPTSHTTRLFLRDKQDQGVQPNGMVKALLSFTRQTSNEGALGVSELASSLGIRLTHQVREQLSLIPGGDEFRYLLWGNGAKAFASLFPKLIGELQSRFDQVIIDTPPDFNVLTRNALACSDLAVVPVDSSAMSIDCLDQLLDSTSHMKGPQWCIVRTLVDRRSRKVQQLSNERLSSSIGLSTAVEGPVAQGSSGSTKDVDKNFKQDHPDVAGGESGESLKKTPRGVTNGSASKNEDCPVYLLRSLIHRTEIQNRLSFVGQTAFDLAFARGLADEYLSVARELEDVIEVAENDNYGGQALDLSKMF